MAAIGWSLGNFQEDISPTSTTKGETGFRAHSANRMTSTHRGKQALLRSQRDGGLNCRGRPRRAEVGGHSACPATQGCVTMAVASTPGPLYLARGGPRQAACSLQVLISKDTGFPSPQLRPQAMVRSRPAQQRPHSGQRCQESGVTTPAPQSRLAPLTTGVGATTLVPPFSSQP